MSELSRDEVREAYNGLYRKFHVQRVDGKDQAGGTKENALYFVLDYVHDPHARVALAAYADSCESDYPGLAADLRDALGSPEEPPVTDQSQLPEDTADYGPYRGGDDFPGPDETTCAKCGCLAIEHGDSRSRAYGVCPVVPVQPEGDSNG